MTPDDDKSLGDGATFSGQVKQSRSDISLGDERLRGQTLSAWRMKPRL